MTAVTHNTQLGRRVQPITGHYRNGGRRVMWHHGHGTRALIACLLRGDCQIARRGVHIRTRRLPGRAPLPSPSGGDWTRATYREDSAFACSSGSWNSLTRGGLCASRHGQGYGVFRFDSKYGANVDGYSPIWSPNEWSATGDEYSGGSLGLIVW